MQLSVENHFRKLVGYSLNLLWHHPQRLDDSEDEAIEIEEAIETRPGSGLSIIVANFIRA